MQPVAEHNQLRLAKRMRWAARVIGLVIISLFLIILIGGAITEGLQTITIEGASLGMLGGIALAGYIISWRHEQLGGILLVLTAAGLGIHIGICAGRNHIMTWSTVGLPYLITGLLFLYSWRLTRKI